MHLRGIGRASRPDRTGVTIVEVTIALVIVTTVLTASAGAFLSNLSTTRAAQRVTQATVFLETVMQDLAVQSYEALPAFNGNRVFDQATEAKSNYSVTLTVFQAGVDLLQIRAVLTDLRADRELGRLTTYRSYR